MAISQFLDMNQTLSRSHVPVLARARVRVSTTPYGFGRVSPPPSSSSSSSTRGHGIDPTQDINRRRVSASHNDYAPPSTIGGCMELDALERYSCVICDSLTLVAGGTRMKSASVSRRVLAGIMANPTSFGQMKFSIEQARMYENESLGIQSGFSKTQLQVNKALVNVAGLLLESSVESSGRVSIEVDPRLAYDAAGLKKNAEVIWAMCAENGISKDRILLQMPATWAAIEAAGAMELEGLQTHLVSVYSYGQAVAAVSHDVSVLQLNVGRINDWYDRNPGAIRDPNGPRELAAMAKAGFAVLENPGLPLVKKVYNYIHNLGKDTKLIASGMRSKKETLSLAGCDFLVVGEQILNSLAKTSTLEGYNDGLHAAGSDDCGMKAAMSPDQAASAEVERVTVAACNFEDALGLIGTDLLTADVQRAVEDATRLEPLFLNRVGGQE